MTKEEAKKAAWKNSIFATSKFMTDLRRSNTVRDIYNEGFDAGHAHATAQLAAMRAALERYADESNWACSQEYEDGHRCGKYSNCDARKYIDDNGYDLAQAAIKENQNDK